MTKFTLTIECEVPSVRGPRERQQAEALGLILEDLGLKLLFGPLMTWPRVLYNENGRKKRVIGTANLVVEEVEDE